MYQVKKKEVKKNWCTPKKKVLKERTAGLIIYQVTPPPPKKKKKEEKKEKKKQLKMQGLLIYQVKDSSETKVPDKILKK